jgi:hypothetical protein
MMNPVPVHLFWDGTRHGVFQSLGSRLTKMRTSARNGIFLKSREVSTGTAAAAAAGAGGASSSSDIYPYFLNILIF